MVGPDWGVVVLVVYPLAQVPLILLLARRLKLDGSGPVVTPSMAYWTAEEPDPQFPAASVTLPGRCRRCGVDNDPAFTFCAGCLARL